MSSPGTLVTAVIALVVLGAIVQLLFLAFRYRTGAIRGRATDDDAVVSEERIDEALYALSAEDQDVDPEETETVACLECMTLNDDAFTFCRGCVAKLPHG